MSRREAGSRGWVLMCALLIGLSTLPQFAVAGERALERQAEQVEAMILRVKPAEVGILTEVGAEVTIRSGKDDTYVVKPVADTENGAGFIIRPDGWIATNGHVVKPVYRDDEEHITEFLQASADAACGPGLAKLPATRRKARMEAILKDPANRKGVKLTKRLEVFLSKRVAPGASAPPGVPAVVKAYSPPSTPRLCPGAVPFPRRGSRCWMPPSSRSR